MSEAYGKVPHFEKPINRLVLGSIAILPDAPDDAFALIDAYVEAGGNAIDTAHIYGPGRHETVGKYLAARGRDTLVVMDKGCHPMGRNRVTRADMFSDVDDSLGRMGIDYLDFFVLHRDDPDVPAADVIGWLNELKEQGKVKAFGGSNWRHERLMDANFYAEKHGLQPFSLSSPNLALAVPQAEMWSGVYWLDRQDRAWFEDSRFPIFSWSSGASGFFAGSESDDVKRVYFNDENFARKARAQDLGARLGLSATQVAVAWALNQPLNVFAITGPRTPDEVRENMKTAAIPLTPEELAYLENG
jgi:aryl-alcohol dehydrogenase-like predicted oxidoreductase